MDSKDEKQCKICLETDGNDLIAPCYCSGSSKWIHRSCLDTWRSTHAGRAFTHCGLCGFEYVIELANDREEECRRIRWKMYVARDTFAVFLLVQAVIIILGFFVKALDLDGNAKNVFPHFLSDHEKTSYYIWGFIVFLAILGLVGVVLKCINHPLFEANHRPAHPYAHGAAPNVQGQEYGPMEPGLVRQNTPRRHRNRDGCCQGRGSTCTGNDCQGCSCYCGDSCCDNGNYCDCSGCGNCNCGGCHGCHCGGGGDLKEGIIVVLVIALVILVFVGLFVVIFLGSLLVQKIMQRHMRILWLREETKKYVVVDFANRTLPPRVDVSWDEENGGAPRPRRMSDVKHSSNSLELKSVDSKKRLYQSQHPESDADEDFDKPRKPSKSSSSANDRDHDGSDHDDAPSAPEREPEPRIPRPLSIRSLSGGPPGGPRTKTFPDGLFD